MVLTAVYIPLTAIAAPLLIVTFNSTGLVRLGDELVAVTEPIWIAPYYAVYGVGYGFYWFGSTIFSGPANLEGRIEERRNAQAAARRASDAAIAEQTRALARWKAAGASTEAEIRDLLKADPQNLTLKEKLGERLDRKAAGSSGLLSSRGAGETFSNALDQAYSARDHGLEALTLPMEAMKAESNKVFDTAGTRSKDAVAPFRKETFNPSRDPQVPKEKRTPAIEALEAKRDEQKKIIAAAEAELKTLENKPENHIKIVEQRTIIDKANNQRIFLNFSISEKLTESEDSPSQP